VCELLARRSTHDWTLEGDMTLTPTFRSASLMPGGPILVVRVNDDGGTCVLSLSGHLDSRSVIGLEAQLDQLRSLAFDELVIDIEKLRSIDAAGFASLVRICRYVTASGREVRIAAGDDVTDLPTSFRRLARRARNNRLFERPPAWPERAPAWPGPRRFGAPGRRGGPSLGLSVGD
jgi:anti-anti-sigma factor